MHTDEVRQKTIEHVIGLFHADRAAADGMAQEFAGRGLQGRFVQHDIKEDLRHGPLADLLSGMELEDLVLVNNASPGFVPKPFHQIAWEEYQQLLDINLKGAIHCIQFVLPRMLALRRGTIVNVLSSAVATFPKGFAAYVAAKCSLEGLSKVLAEEYQGRGVRVISVTPGFMDTALTRAWPPILREAVLHGKQPDDPESVARFILAVARGASTGQGCGSPR